MSEHENTDLEQGDSELAEVVDLVTGILVRMGLDAGVDGRVDGRFLRLNVTGADADQLVSGSGAAASSHVLDALQLIAMRRQLGSDSGRTVVIDAGDFREHRLAELETAAARIGDTVAERGDAIRVWGMNSFDRRAIHLALKERGDVRTDSEGDGVFRVLCVVSTAGDKDKDKGKQDEE